MKTTKFSFAKEFQQAAYAACLEEIGTAIEQLRIESGCSVKPLMRTLRIGHASLKGVYRDKP